MAEDLDGAADTGIADTSRTKIEVYARKATPRLEGDSGSVFFQVMMLPAFVNTVASGWRSLFGSGFGFLGPAGPCSSS